MRRPGWICVLALTAGVIGTSCANGGASGAGDAPPEPPLPGSISAQQIREDFDLLYAGLKQAHFELDHHLSMDELDRHFERLSAEIEGPMTPFEAGVLFQRFVSRVGLGHTRVAFPVAEWSECTSYPRRNMKSHPQCAR